MKTEFQYSGVNEYLAQFEPPIRTKLEEIRQAIRETAPGSEEKISYMMPTFFNNGVLVHFAAFKNHIGFFPGPSGIEAFREELSGFETSKGTMRIPLDKPLPLDLIKEIVRFRVEENRQKAEIRMQKKKGSGKSPR